MFDSISKIKKPVREKAKIYNGSSRKLKPSGGRGKWSERKGAMYEGCIE